MGWEYLVGRVAAITFEAKACMVYTGNRKLVNTIVNSAHEGQNADATLSR